MIVIPNPINEKSTINEMTFFYVYESFRKERFDGIPQKEIVDKGLDKEIKVIKTGCFGLCALGPIMIVYPEGCFYSEVKVDDIPEIVEEHLLKGRIVTRLLYDETVVNEAEVKSLNETNFYKKQKRIALRNCGVIDPENIEEYIAYDGYQALAKCLTELTPEQVVQIVNFFVRLWYLLI